MICDHNLIDDVFVIDAHTHVMEKTIPTNPPVKEEWNFTPQTLIERMDETGVDMSIIINTGERTKEENIKQNNYYAEKAKQHSNRIAGFIASCIPPFGEFALLEMDRCVKELSAKGIKLYPFAWGYPVDSEITYPFIERAIKHKIAIYIHSDFNSKYNNPYQITRLADIFPDATLIMAHMGYDVDMYPLVPDIVKKYENVILETSATMSWPQYVYVKSVKILGSDRIVFGSDAPPLDMALALKQVEQAEKLWGLKKEDKKQILGANIAKILGLSYPK